MTLADLQRCIADRETEGIEFKPSLLSRKEIAEYSVGIGNAGGGHLIMGVTDKLPRQIQSVSPLSADEIQQVSRSIYDSAQIHIRVENLGTPAGNVVIVAIPTRPRGQVFHTRDGKYLIRVGEDLRGLAMAELDAIRQETAFELSAEPVPGNWKDILRPAGMEDLRALMAEARAEADLLRLGDQDLLRALGVLSPDGQLLTAGLLLVGRSEELQRRVPNAQWSFFRMVSDTDYDQVERGQDCFAVALRRFRELVNANNPIVTIKGDLVHPEFPRYPHLAIRELLVNALAHRDYAAPGGVVLKLYPDRLELSNPGAFLGGITPHNILHHASVPRYPVLFGALARVRVANAANLGVSRVFRDFLTEGKEPPYYWSPGASVVVTVKGQDTRPAFANLTLRHPDLTVDELLVLQHLTRHREISARQAAELCQRPLDGARETLARLANRERLAESGGPAGKGRYYRLTQDAYAQLGDSLAYHVDSRLSRENVKGRILTALDKGPLSNAEIREITQLDRSQVLLTMRRLQTEGLVQPSGKFRQTRWHLKSGVAPDPAAIANAKIALPMQNSHKFSPPRPGAQREDAPGDTSKGQFNREQLKNAILMALAAGPLSNAALRQLTQTDRHKTLRLLRLLETAGLIQVIGSRKAGHWALAAQPRRKV